MSLEQGKQGSSDQALKLHGSSLFTFNIRTMGCKANIYDSLVLERELCEIGGVKSAEDTSADVYIMNSCTVTAEADKQALRDVAQARKVSPGTLTVMTGCFAQVAEKDLGENKDIDLVVTNARKNELRALVARKLGVAVPESLPEEEFLWGQLPALSSDKTRAFLKVQEGCNDFCTYCIIPYGRGPSRSVRLGKILDEVNRLVDQGIQEVIVTGTNIADYGLEFGTSFDDLIEAILSRTGVKRLRLSSLDPTEISDRLIGMMKGSSVLMPHFHVSLQSAQSRVLRAMKRKYRSEEVVGCLEKIYAASPDIFVGMDVIAGFPSETLEEHNEGVALLKRLPWTRLHVFPYSEREGTPALKIPGSVPKAERKRRAAELMELSRTRHEAFVSRYVGQRAEGVLFESAHQAGLEHFVIGHMPNYVRVLVRTTTAAEAEALRNTTRAVKTHLAVPKPAQDWTLESGLV